MKVELEKVFPMPATPEVAWAFLQDIEGVAGCMPGAKITARIDAAHFKGTVSVRVGPASMSFKGDIEVQELDANQRLLHLIGKGSDTTGSSGASMDLLARIEPATDGTSQLVGRSEVTMSGKAAAFGGRMMGTVADQILKQFAGNFAAQVKARAAAAMAGAGTAQSGAAAAGTTAADTAHSGASAAGTTTSDTAHSSAAATAITQAPRVTIAHTSAHPSAGAALPTLTSSPTPTGSTAPPSPPAPANELNALALLWAIIRDWFRGLFRRRPA